MAEGEQQWGTFDATTQAVHLHQDAEPNNEDLLDTTAIQTLLNGGTVYTLTSEQMPGNSCLAALFRY